MAPNLDPTVSTGSCSAQAASDPTASPATVPGTALMNRGTTSADATTATANTAAAGVDVPRCAAMACMRGMNSPVFSEIVRPRKSRICVLAMSTAMPFVNPTTTGRGMNFTAVPVPVSAATTSITPAIIVHMNRPDEAVGRDDARDHHDEGTGRAADLDVRAAKRGDQEAGDDRAVDAGLGREARGDRERHRQR